MNEIQPLSLIFVLIALLASPLAFTGVKWYAKALAIILLFSTPFLVGRVLPSYMGWCTTEDLPKIFKLEQVISATTVQTAEGAKNYRIEVLIRPISEQVKKIDSVLHYKKVMGEIRLHRVIVDQGMVEKMKRGQKKMESGEQPDIYFEGGNMASGMPGLMPKKETEGVTSIE